VTEVIYEEMDFGQMDKNICSCCGMPKHHIKKFNLCSKPSSLKDLGQGIPLYFEYKKMTIVLFGIMSLFAVFPLYLCTSYAKAYEFHDDFAAIYDFRYNLFHQTEIIIDGEKYDLEAESDLNAIFGVTAPNKLSIGNVGDMRIPKGKSSSEYTSTEKQDFRIYTLNFLLFFVFNFLMIFIAHGFTMRVKYIEQYIDEEVISPSDFAVIATNLPEDLNEIEISKHFMKVARYLHKKQVKKDKDREEKKNLKAEKKRVKMQMSGISESEISPVKSIKDEKEEDGAKTLQYVNFCYKLSGVMESRMLIAASEKKLKYLQDFRDEKLKKNNCASVSQAKSRNINI
jgi:hypothetical protein